MERGFFEVGENGEVWDLTPFVARLRFYSV